MKQISLKLKAIGIAAALTMAGPLSAEAATISGQVDIAGTINLPTSTISAVGNADLNNPGTVIFATGDFSSLFPGVGYTD